MELCWQEMNRFSPLRAEGGGLCPPVHLFLSRRVPEREKAAIELIVTQYSIVVAS